MTLLISEQQLLTSGLLSPQADVKKLASTINLIQDIFIEPLLGSDLMAELKDQVKNNTVTTDNRRLIEDYIQSCMEYYVLSELPEESLNRQSIAGLPSNIFSMYAARARMEESQNLAGHFRNLAATYAFHLARFLMQNKETYPLYKNECNSITNHLDFGIKL